MSPKARALVEKAMERLEGEAVALLQQLVRIPSANHPPTGDEKQVQEFYAQVLGRLGVAVDLFEPNDVPAFLDHPGRLREHDMAGRPDVAGAVKGTGGGRSLMLLAHADVEVPGDASLWTDRDPFSGALRDGRIYGRGSGDDKSGMMVNAMAVRVLRDCGIRLRGDLTVASVADEERGGGNGTVALLARGYHADACINVDGINGNVALSNLGGGGCTIELLVPGPVRDGSSLIDHFVRVRDRLDALGAERVTEFAPHPFDGVPPFNSHPVKLVDISLAVDDYTHGTLQVWFYLLPGESEDAFKVRLEKAVAGAVGPGTCKLHWQTRLLPSSEVARDHPFAVSLLGAYEQATSRRARITGSPMSDMGLVSKFGAIPCICHAVTRWDVEGMAHQPNEYIEVEKLMECLKTVVFCAMDWCGCSPA